jgi:hypothetical protein
VSDDHFLRRWSKRKHQTNRGEAPPPAAVAAQAQVPPSAPSAPLAEAPPAPLPDVESLTPESDFAPFMREGVPGDLKQRALKTLFQDPRFNVMDGLDVYIDDYSKPDPLPDGWLEKLNQMARLGEYREPEEEEAAIEAEGPPEGPESPEPSSRPVDTSPDSPNPPEVPES